MFEGHLGAALLDASHRYADRAALWVDNQHYSYSELFERATRMALALQDAGVQPGECVCILSYRSVTNYAAVIGALLAGCTYVPMNSYYRPHRNNTILRVSGAKAMILDARCSKNLDEHLTQFEQDLLMICPEPETLRPAVARVTMAEDMPEPDQTRLAVREAVSAEFPAYLMFTSGTTGDPKGVPITSANVAAFVEGISRVGPLTCEDRVLQWVELAFDFSVQDLFPTWLHGAELYSLPLQYRDLLTRFIADYGITSSTLLPGGVSLAIDRKMVTPGKMPKLRQCFYCGEALATSVARRWQEGAPNCRVFNLYGPTEATVALTSYEFNPDEAQDLPVVPIGTPFPGQEVGLFGPDLKRVAQGETGQMFLSGSQVMAGYWRAPQINAEKMVMLEGRLWYKTGDLARWREPYGLIFAGRADRQMKINTCLVELQDVEAILRGVMQREEVAVVAWPRTSDTSADGTVAFATGEPLDVAQVRAACAAIAEEYMVPSNIYFLSDLPHNSNGKVDYKVLEEHPLLSS